MNRHRRSRVGTVAKSYTKYAFSRPDAYVFKRPRTPATVGGPALIRGPVLKISLKFSVPFLEENDFRDVGINQVNRFKCAITMELIKLNYFC